MNIEIADRLTKLRKEHNLSQEALAEKLGISRQAVSKWERAEASPDTDNLIQLARLYQVSLDELLGIEPAAGGQASAAGGWASDLAAEGQSQDPAAGVQSSDPAAERPSPVLEAEVLQPKYPGTGQPVKIVEEEAARINYKALHRFPVSVVVTLAYVIMGSIWGGWHPGWLLFFIPPIWHSVLVAAKRRNAKCFAYPVLVALLFLCAGIFFSLWHPGWILFLTIPLYYPLVDYFQRVYREQKVELDQLIKGNVGEEIR